MHNEKWISQFLDTLTQKKLQKMEIFNIMNVTETFQTQFIPVLKMYSTSLPGIHERMKTRFSFMLVFM